MQPEILAPVGGAEQLLAAVRTGADAVYLGSKSFNARRGAENFDDDALAQAVRYCHGRGVKVHVTLNTLVTQAELGTLTAELQSIAASGADAVIVQDLGVAALVRQCCPTLALHASTQLSVHNLAGALLMGELGFTRVVLARELTAREIGQIKEKSGLEVEIFVHGALCMSLSGSCYLSALLGERSGNRGMCAQPCRLDWQSGGRDYALSLKDLTLIPRMAQLVELGVDSLKIEGRLKRPEYVAAAVTACRQALAGEQPDMERLQAVFSRSGFTDGYFAGQRTSEMFGYRRKEDVAAAGGVLGELAALYRGETGRVPVKMAFSMRAGKPAQLTVTDGTHRVSATGELPQSAINRPTDLALARRGLEKLGGTPFVLDNLDATIEPGLMLPVSAVNALRKAAAEKLLALREATPPHAFTPPAPLPVILGGASSRVPALRIRLERVEQLTSAVKSSVALIILPLWELYSHQELVGELGDRLAAELPLLVFGEDQDRVEAQLSTLGALGLQKALVTTQGSLALARRVGLTLLGDYTLNILNSVALGAYAQLGLTDATLSYEGSMRNARAMDARMPLGVVGYGHLPVMTFRNCPARGAAGCGGCTGFTSITDRRGEAFPLLCRQKQYTQLLNPVPLYLGDRQETLLGLAFVTLLFTTESPEAVDDLLSLWRNNRPYPDRRTGGLYFRELQ